MLLFQTSEKQSVSTHAPANETKTGGTRNCTAFFKTLVRFLSCSELIRIVSQVRRVQKEVALIDVMTDIPVHEHFAVRI